MMIDVTLLIDNYYEGGEKIETTVKTTMPAPPDEDSDEYEDWLDENIFSHTGVGNESGESAYFVTIDSSSEPDILAPGREFEFL